MKRTLSRDDRFKETEQRLREQLLQGLEGDARAYHAFLQALSTHLRAYFKNRLFQRPHEAEDLVQETLLAVHNQRHTYRRDQPLTAWVHAMAHYKLVDWLRAHASKEALTDPIDDELEVFAQSDNEATDAKRDLDKLLDTLPDRQRLPIMYVKVEGLSVAEAAARTGMSAPAIKIGVHRGLKALAAKIRGTT